MTAPIRIKLLPVRLGSPERGLLASYDVVRGTDHNPPTRTWPSFTKPHVTLRFTRELATLRKEAMRKILSEV